MEISLELFTQNYTLGNYFNLPVYVWILLSLALLILLQQCVFYFKYFRKIILYKPSEIEESFVPEVSVVICAKNEKINLQNNLPAILEQNYPKFEVVVVNDGSWDGTDEVLSVLADKYPHIKIVDLNENIKRIEGKKFPLTLGIKASSYDILLLTDADCKPVSSDWIKQMVMPYQNPEIEIVLGYSPYSYRKSFLNLLIRAETALTALMYFSFALLGKAYMGVGRNLSYKKELFFKHKGFASHHHIPAGDDDLFIRDAATRSNTAVIFSPNSRMISNPKTNFKSWIQQKRRHLFVGNFYNKKIKKTLSGFAINHFAFWTILILAVVLTGNFLPSIILLGLRWMIQIPLIFMALKRLGYKYLTFLLPLLDFLYLFYSIFTFLMLSFTKKPKW